MFRFENPYMLWLLLILPVMTVLFMLTRKWQRNARTKYVGIDLLAEIIPRISTRKPVIKFGLYGFAYFLLIIAVANPQIGTKLEEIKREGVDIIIALDVSNSMMAEDFKPNRLERAKRAIEKLVENLKSDRIGIVVFAGNAFIQLPITSDYSAAKLYTSSINTKTVPTQGTALGTAIEKCISALEHDDSNNKAIIVISDGENHEDDPLGAAKKAAKKGILIHTIGMGSPKGSPIPIYNGKNKVGYKSDKSGTTVVSKLDENMLKEIASVGQGVYVRATNSSTGLRSIFDEINRMEKKEYEAKQYTDYEDRFQPFISLALLILLIEFILSETKSKWIEKLNLFND
jgi:Ca-activated chloride channel family protein